MVQTIVLGILFIGYSSRGHQIVFSYPDNNKFLGFESPFLSHLLSPKSPTLCDSQFQITIDSVTFVGHASLLNSDRPGLGLLYTRQLQKNLHFLNRQNLLYNVEEQHPLSMFHLVIALKADDSLLHFTNAIYDNVFHSFLNL